MTAKKTAATTELVGIPGPTKPLCKVGKDDVSPRKQGRREVLLAGINRLLAFSSPSALAMRCDALSLSAQQLKSGLDATATSCRVKNNIYM